jgi:hypothetical protein
MLVTFKSKAAAEILMYEKHAKPILNLLGKDVARGIITASEAPQAIARLEAAIEEHRRQEASDQAEREARAGDDEEPSATPAQGVSFATRVYPLLEMLRAAQKTSTDVMWGV